jgi:hypothetical protein
MHSIADLIEQRIYWTDFRNNSIKSAKVDGSDVQLIISGLMGPVGIELHNNDNSRIKDNRTRKLAYSICG